MVAYCSQIPHIAEGTLKDIETSWMPIESHKTRLLPRFASLFSKGT